MLLLRAQARIEEEEDEEEEGGKKVWLRLLMREEA